MQPQSLEGRIATLTGEVQDLRALLSKAIEHLPKPGLRYVSASALAKELGISQRSLLRWASEGRIDSSCFTIKKRGTQQFQYVFDRHQVIPAIEAIQRGDR